MEAGLYPLAVSPFIAATVMEAERAYVAFSDALERLETPHQCVMLSREIERIIDKLRLEEQRCRERAHLMTEGLWS